MKAQVGFSRLDCGNHDKIVLNATLREAIRMGFLGGAKDTLLHKSNCKKRLERRRE
jgi:hypothetical protein